ncbi:RNA polymerase sigma factor [Fibrobacter sp.]|uniref:RNA polymerase sigma factor n=1 Tax=Fibrobacter sp. TaxID=35828 RepID=UPI00388E2D43
MSKSRILTERPSQWVEKLWSKNAPKIYKLCRSQSSDTERAKDLFQEVALRLCRSAATLDLERPIDPWFRAVVHNAFCDMNRRVLPVIPFSHFSESFIEYHARGLPSIAKEVCEDRRGKYVRKTLDHLMEDLSSAEKLAVEFSCIGEMGTTEASLFCGVERSTFTKRKSKALKKMRQKKDIYMASLKNSESSRLNLEDLLTRASEFS